MFLSKLAKKYIIYNSSSKINSSVRTFLKVEHSNATLFHQKRNTNFKI